MTPLYQEMHRWATSPFVWGELDCMLSVCDWVKRVQGVDPASQIRGTYFDMASCQRETGFFRNPVQVVDRFFAKCGLERVDAPSPGDVAVIRNADQNGTFYPCGALWLGTSWGCKGLTGATTLSAPIVGPALAIWGVGYEA